MAQAFGDVDVIEIFRAAEQLRVLDQTLSKTPSLVP